VRTSAKQCGLALVGAVADDLQRAAYRWPVRIQAIVFFIVAMLVAGVIWHQERARLSEERSRAADLAAAQVHAIELGIERVLGATHALAAMLRHGNGSIDDFEAAARHMLGAYPGAIGLQLAPDGVVRQVFPLRGVEESIGYDLLRDPVRGEQMRQARASGQVVVLGPFHLLHGGLAAAGRLPVFIDNGQGREVFWGFAIVLFSLPEVLTQARLSDLGERGYVYRLLRGTNKGDEQRIIVASSADPPPEPVQQPLHLASLGWTLELAPQAGWNHPYGLLGKILVGLAFSLLLAWQAGWQRRSMAARRAHEEALEQRLAQRAADLQRFAEVTAHHLQEPARRVVSYSGRLREQLAGRIDDREVAISLDFICAQAERLRKLLGDLELFLAADQPLGKSEPCDGAETVHSVLVRFSGQISAAGARVVVGQLPPVFIDARRLAHMFEIALDNALRHARGEQPLVIEITGIAQGQRVRYLISDNGPGIEEEYRERVFRVFERLSSGGEGTGVGLAILRRIAESAAGRAWLEEAVSGGCCLVLELPASSQPEALLGGARWP